MDADDLTAVPFVDAPAVLAVVVVVAGFAFAEPCIAVVADAVVVDLELASVSESVADAVDLVAADAAN